MTNPTDEKQALEEKELLTAEEVWDVIAFARAYQSGLYGGAYLNPELVSGRMKDVTLNPVVATESALETALREPKTNELQLQEYSQSFEVTSMMYKRLLSYLSDMLSFDITYTTNADKKDYETPKFKKDQKAVEEFLDSFDYKHEFSIVVRELLRNDAYFGCFRKVGGSYILQELPSEFCKITGRWENGFLFSFNMYWFQQPGVDVNMYDPFFKKKYREIWSSSKGLEQYNPSLSPELRGKSTWVYWVDVPVDVGFCFKLSPELATRIPYFTPLFSDLLLQPLMRSLQKNLNMAEASKIITGEIPYLSKDAKSSLKDSVAITPDLLGKFLALVKSAIGDAVKVASAPLENMQSIDFKGNTKLYEDYTRTTLATTGVNSNLIFSSNIKPNAIETQLSLNVDEQLMESLYSQFNHAMNYWASLLTKYFRYKFEFEGTDFYLNRQQRIDQATSLFDKGIVLPQKIAAAHGMKPHHLYKMMEEADATGFMSKLTPPSVEQARQMQEFAPEPVVPGSTPETPSGKKGRPAKKDSELSDEGSQTRTQGTNIPRGGKQ